MRHRELPANGKWFVGRAGELAAIGACVDAVSGGAARMVWVEGDPGSGKTALVSHVVAKLLAAFVVLQAAADESTADQPFAVLEQLGIEGGGSPQAVGLDLVAWLTKAGGPVAVVVEDLHWADRESRQALLTVVRRVGEERVLLLVTSRPGAASDGWERLLLDPSGSLRVVLGALSRDDVGEMVRVAGLALPWRAVGRLHEHSGGLALYVRTLLAELSVSQLAAPGGELPVQLSQLLLSSGEWDEALVHARAALSLVSAERRVWMDAQVHAAMARLFGGRGEWQRAAEHLAAADAAAGEAGTIEAVVTTRVALASVARARNDPEEVVKIFAPLVENPHLIPMSTSLAWWPTLIGAMIDRGELAQAAEQIELLGTAAQQRGLDMQARIAGVRAHLEAARGRPDQACSSYDRAIALLGPDDPLLDRAELHHRFGQLLAARGGRRRQAVDQLRLARDLFAKAGAEPFLRRVEADLASQRITVSRPGSRSPLELTDRERDVAVLVAKGMTNRRRPVVCQPESRRLPPGPHFREAGDHLKAGPAPAGVQLAPPGARRCT